MYFDSMVYLSSHLTISIPTSIRSKRKAITESFQVYLVRLWRRHEHGVGVPSTEKPCQTGLGQSGKMYVDCRQLNSLWLLSQNGRVWAHYGYFRAKTEAE
jgi:hypothetical protein